MRQAIPSPADYARDRDTLIDALRSNLYSRWRWPGNAGHWRTMARNKIRLIRELDRIFNASLEKQHAPTR